MTVETQVDKHLNFSTYSCVTMRSSNHIPLSSSSNHLSLFSYKTLHVSSHSHISHPPTPRRKKCLLDVLLHEALVEVAAHRVVHELLLRPVRVRAPRLVPKDSVVVPVSLNTTPVPSSQCRRTREQRVARHAGAGRRRSGTAAEAAKEGVGGGDLGFLLLAGVLSFKCVSIMTNLLNKYKYRIVRNVVTC